MSPSSPLILYVITDLEIGGVPLHLVRLAKSMRDRGFRVVVVSLLPIGPIGPILSDDGLDVRTCHGCCGWDFRVIPRLGQIIDELQPDVIHSLLFHANQASRVAAMLSGFPKERILCEIQTVEVERRWHLWVDRLMYRFCRLTIGNSPSVIDHLHRAARIPQDRLQLVRGGIDVDRIAGASPASRAALGLKESDRIIMWVGRLDPVKGLDHLLLALVQVAQKSDVHLVLVGDGSERTRLEALARSLQLQSRVHFLGPRNDVASLLKIADVFTFPSRTEGLPNALLEAMAAGKAIVTTDVPGCRDLIVHEQTGLLVPYGDAPSLSAALGRLLGDAALARRLGQSAQETVASEWSAASAWNSYEALYRSILTLPRHEP